MKKKLLALSTVLVIFGMDSVAQATLITIGTATYYGSDYNLIWDNDNNGNSVVWLDYSNSLNTWQNQFDWSTGLDSLLTYNINSTYIVAWDDETWRLPQTVNVQYELGYDGTSSAGYNITNSEMGHLYYEELGNAGYRDTDGDINVRPAAPDSYLQNTGQFNNLIGLWHEASGVNVASWYWSEIYIYDSGLAWGLQMYDGNQSMSWLGNSGFCLAIRSGQVATIAPVPEPATMLLFGIGLAGLVGNRIRKKAMG